jgi:hypothetical protein
MIARVYFRDGAITAVCTGAAEISSADEFREIPVVRMVGLSDFEMHDGEPRLRAADSPPRRFENMQE